ncbi:hypothetical protein [Nocardiopsis sp. Huas11]|uniref:hypothetical protein n=1 Tax=Nocardiopsis sp. Huas11 TaxID=2183912 RepID=UPI000EAE9B0B|nr:hypothetical protein [Nocardiopsis sp. Huas11]
MIDIYSLVLAGLLVAMSTVGDRFGRRRNLLLGAVVFALAVLELSRSAFTEAITVTGLAGAGVMAFAAIWALVTLRGASAHQDLAAEHERENGLEHGIRH